MTPNTVLSLCYSSVLNKREGGLNNRRDGKFSENLMNDGVHISGVGGESGNLFEKMRYKIIATCLYLS